MITDIQVRKLLKFLSQGKSLETAAARSGMDEKTGRKYRNLNMLPSDIKVARSRSWRTRNDPVGEFWGTAESFLKINDGLEAKLLFTYFQREIPGRIGGGQLRTFQRRVKSWRATEGAGHEVFFPKRHDPGKMSRSSFRNLSELGVSLAGHNFDHLVFHFVLTYSNWETGSVFLAEDFPSLSAGLQKSLWDIGGSPKFHRPDKLDAMADKPAEFKALLNHYRISELTNRADSPDDKQTVEQRHRHFEMALNQALILRGSRDFDSLTEYEKFLRRLFEQLNQKRLYRLQDEQAVLHRLPREKWGGEDDAS
ncbi:MAG TPA: hypothetical protein DDY32_16885 [Desulfobulbaceae bacterium]|nr:hypothetical protein [Desulfobulbaceae bacterium]